MSTPLNPDALEAACRTLWESTENYPQQWEHVSPAVKKNLRKTVSKFASAYLAAALPEVTSDKASTWQEGFEAGWAEAKDPGAFVNDVWDAKTPNPHCP